MGRRNSVEGLEMDSNSDPTQCQELPMQHEAMDTYEALTAEEHAALWRTWVDSGPQGPIEDDDEGWSALATN